MSLHDRRDLTQAPRGAALDEADCEAAFILREAQALGIRVRTDGSELLALMPVQVPRETRLWFETKLYEYKAKVIEVIQRDNAGGYREVDVAMALHTAPRKRGNA